MSRTKKIIILAVLALAMSQQAASEDEDRPQNTCKKFGQQLKNVDKNQTPRFFIDYAKAYRGFTLRWFSKKFDRVISALEAILLEEECSESSVGHLDLMSKCSDQLVKEVPMISQKTLVYRDKCLSASVLNQRIKSEAAKSRVDFLSAAVIEKEASDVKYWASWERANLAKGYYISDAICKDLKQKGFNAGNAMPFGRASDDLVDSMNKMLFEPCAHYIESVGPFLDSLESAVGLYEKESKFKELIETLDHEARDAIFRRSYCRAAIFIKDELMYDIARNLMKES